jgi:hypothetical protein
LRAARKHPRPQNFFKYITICGTKNILRAIKMQSEKYFSRDNARVAETSDKSLDDAPKVELKPLPVALRYEYLRPNETCQIIINTDLNDNQTQKLLRELRIHRKAIGYMIRDLKGINPSICMHRILMEDDHKLTIEGQRRLNPNLSKVVWKEIHKLLDARIIYPISDSKWVSPVYVIPKKRGITVVKGENDEMIATRLVTG